MIYCADEVNIQTNSLTHTSKCVKYHGRISGMTTSVETYSSCCEQREHKETTEVGYLKIFKIFENHLCQSEMDLLTVEHLSNLELEDPHAKFYVLAC